MYCEAEGLGQYPVIGMVTGGWLPSAPTDPCADTLFRMTHQAQCAPTVSPTVEIGTTKMESLTVTPAPTLQTVVESAAPLGDEEAAVVVTSGGWGGATPLVPLDDGGVSVQAGDVIVEGAEPEGRGFGLVEAALAAGLAWVLASSYRRRRRR